MSLDHLWAGWRSSFVESAAAGTDDGCVFCRILASGEPDEQTYVLRRDERVLAILNAYPYTNGHLMVMPVRHVGQPEELDEAEGRALWCLTQDAVRAVKQAYQPDGLNLGANLGRAAGAGVPGHFHIHCLPRWNGDSNFMTAVAETRVLPEALSASWQKLRATWPS